MNSVTHHKSLAFGILLLCLSCLLGFSEPVQAQCAIGTQGGPGVFYQGCTETTGSGTSTTLTQPGGTQVGDFLLASISTDGSTSPVPVGGWTLLQTNNTQAVTLSVWYRVATTAGAATFAVNWTGTEDFVATLMRFTNVDDIPVSAFATGTTDPVAPTLNTDRANSLVIRLSAKDRRETNLTGGLTQITSSLAGSGAAIVDTAIGFVNQAASGPTGVYNFSNTNDDGWHAATIALRPVPVITPFFIISNTGVGFACAPNLITITRDDGTGSVDTSYTGTITLSTISTISGSGAWSVGGSGALGTLTDLGGGDAEYTFAFGDNGSVTLEYSNISTGTVNFNVADGLIVEDPGSDPDLVIGPCSFLISHNNSGATCAPSLITITAYEPDFTGTINLSTDTLTPNGSWAVGSSGALGALTDLGGGSATYTFAAGDNGEVTLEYSDTSTGSVNFNVLETLTTFSESALADPTLTLTACEFRISIFSSATTCAPTAITFRVADGAGSTVNNYSGTATITASPASGFWGIGSANGSLSAGSGDGTATYTFAAADAGIIALEFFDSNTGSVNFNISDSIYGFSEAIGFDPNLIIAACAAIQPVVFDFQCYADAVTGTIGIPSQATNSNRMVLLSMHSEGNPVFPTSADFAPGVGGTTMTEISSAYLDDVNADNLVELWGILDTAMPTAAGTYTANFSGGPAGNTSICLISLIDVEQVIPMGDGAALPVNFTTTDNPGTDQTTTVISTQADNSFVLSSSGIGEGNPFSSSTLLALGGTTLWNFDGGTRQFAGFSAIIPTTGTLSVTDTGNGNSFNRVGQVVASFSPAPSVATQFRITHNNIGALCTDNVITIEAYNDYGSVQTDYTGSITLSTSNGLGNWIDIGGTANTVTNAGSGDATYTFLPGDNGVIQLGFSQPVTGSVNFNVTDGSISESSFFDNNLVIGDCFFRISNVGNAYTCSEEAVTISAVDSAGTTLTAYSGTLNLTTSTGNGTWSIGSANGILNNLGGGSATYTFTPADNGVAVLGFHDAVVETVNINVTDGIYSEQAGFDPNISVLNTCEFQIFHSGFGDTCTVEPVTISIIDGDGGPGNKFTGLINLSTSTAKGTWTLNTGGGVLTDPSSGDGLASYTFIAADAGQVILDFAIISSAADVNFNVSGGGFLVDSGADPDMVINDCGFNITFGGGNNSDVCSLKTVTVTAVDGVGSPLTYTGTINLSTSLTTGKGTWTLDTGAGTFNDPALDDGAASYTFVPADGGVVVFEFRHTTPGLVNIDISGGSLNENASADPDLTVADCFFLYSISSPSINACSFVEATLEVRDSSNNLATDFAGTVNLSTNTVNGNWLATTDGLGTLTDINPNDGIATYEFIPGLAPGGDGGIVTFEFSSETVETLTLEAEFNGSVVDPLFDPAYDPELDITQCRPSIFDTQCYTTESEALAISLPSSTETGGSRMVLLYTNVESQVASTIATISTNPMTLLRTETGVNGGVTNVLQVFAILDADLPTGAGTYSAAHDGNADAAMCIVAVEGVKQSFPVQNATTPASGQLNGTNYTAPGSGNAATDITANENNSILLSVAANGQDGTSYTSSLATPEWIAGAADAAGADWAGNSDFLATAALVTVTETNSGTPNAEAHIALALAPFISGDPIVNGYVPVTLFQTYSGNVNYRATGNTLRNLPNTSNADACSFFDPPIGAAGDQTVNNITGTTAVLDLPLNSTIVDAYLYWAGSGRDADIDNTVSFGVDGAEIAITADGIYQIDNPYGFDLEYFAGYKNITPLITTTPGAIYRFKDLTVRISEPDGGIDWGDIQGCLGGWGMVVVYENPLEDLNVINLFDGFQPFRFTSFTLTPRNFRMGSPDGVSRPNGQITHLTFEGDDSLNEPGELFELQNATSTLTFTSLINSENFTIANGGVDAQYNDTITYPVYDGNLDFNPTGGDGAGYTIASTTSYGTDVDTYYIQGALPGSTQLEILYPFGLSGAEQITTLYGTGQDGVFLTGEFISVNNAPIADLEVFISQSGSFKVGSSGTGVYNYTVTNNGNGTGATPPGPPFNYANGDVVMTINLPTGMTAANVAENGWTCLADVPVPNATAFTCVFDIGANYTTGTVNFQLWGGESLPDVVVTVNLDNESSYPLLTNTVSQSARIAHTENYPGTCVVESPGVQPDPTICEYAPQFDNVNDLNKNIIDIDDLDEKTANNNNVVQLDTDVTGIATDLRMVKSLVGVLEENQPAQYLLTVTNLGPDITTATMTVTDTLPDGLVPSTAIGTNWNCNISGQDVTCTRSTPLGIGASTAINITSVSVVAPAIEGSFISNTALVQAGTFNFDLDQFGGDNADTLTSQVVGEPVASNRKFLISVNELSDLGTGAGELVGFQDGDLVLYDPQTDIATMFLAEADIPGGTNLNNVNALHLLPNGQILISTDTDGSIIAGLTFNAEDVVLYDPILQTATVVFSGTGVFDTQANIDAIHVQYNGSYDPSDWDLIVSTEDDELISTVAYDDNDLIQFDLSPATPTATLRVDGADSEVFGADTGDIDAFYIDFENEDIYTLSTDDPGTVTIGGPIDQDSYTHDDLVQLNLTTPTLSVAENVFLGDVANGVFLPASPTRKLDAVHVIEDGYYGHFAIISSGSADTCSPTSITIRRHVGLTHVTDTNYAGSIRLSNDSGAGQWQADISANGMLIDSNTSDGEAIYTFDAADNGEVVLFLKDTGPVNLNVDVTNFYNREDSNEDNDILVSEFVTNVNYLDTFASANYNNNDGIASFSSNWVEINDDNSATTGAIKVVSGKLNLTNPGGTTFPEILREIDFSGYTPNTVTDPLTLDFVWSRNNGAPADSFQVQARNNPPSGVWTTLATVNNLTGAIAGNAVSLDLTAAGITPTSSVQIKFVLNAGYQIESFNLDNIELSTASNDCNVGGSVDHYAISNSGFGISCLVENITIIPHTLADLTTQPGAGVTITLNTGGKGTWFPPVGGAGPFSNVPGTGFAQYTYQAGEDVLVFPFNYTDPATDPETVNFTLLDSNIPSKAQLENQSLSVSRAGLRFFNDTAGNMTYPTLVAGMDSFLYTNQILTVQAIQASDNNPAVCEDIFTAGTDVQIELAFECADPAVCSATTIPVEVTNNGNTTAIEPLDNNAGAGANPGGYDPITLRFETFTNGDFDQDPGPGTNFSYTGARIDLNYADAGSLQIHGRYNIPFEDGAGAQSGNYMEGSGDNLFVVRPFGYDIDVIVDTGTGPQADRRLGGGNDTDAYSWADDANDNGTFVAGEGFSTIVTAIAWDPLDDDGLVNSLPIGIANDGIPDAGSDLFDNDPTPNYGNESDPAQNNMTIVQSLNSLMPVAAVTGTLTNTAYTDFNANNGSQTNALVWDEVGIINLAATLDSGSYLGSNESITGNLFNLGRFIPANFTVTMTNLVSRPLFMFPAANFTYMGEDFTAEFTLTAINALASPTTTQNYIGDFAKLDTPGELSFFAIEDVAGIPDGNDINYSARLQISPTNANVFPADFSGYWAAGVAPLSGTLTFNRQDAPSQVDYDLSVRQEEAPITSLQIAVTALDDDNVIDTGRNVDDDDGSVETDTFLYNLIGTQEFRYGRIRLENAYGSEIPEEQELDGEDQNVTGEDIPVYIIAEYFDGTDFVPNTDDITTPYSSANLSLVAGSFTDNLNAGNTTSTITVGSGLIYQGLTEDVNPETVQALDDKPLYLAAPGEGNDGSVLIDLDLDALGLSFLKYEWRGAGEIQDENQDSSFDDNPRALIEFGVFQTNPRIINWQELFLE